MATDSHQLPTEVEVCVKNARYLHFATSGGLWPHVSLMNYTYIPSNPFDLPAEGKPVIVLTIQPSAKKIANLQANPRVSLLVHDWVSHRTSFSAEAPQQPQSSLASLLSNLNSAALSSISATLFGYAHLIESGTEEEKYYRKVHTENCTAAGESMCYLNEESTRIAVVAISWARVADHKGSVKDWIAPGQEKAWKEFEEGTPAPQVNGAI
ncbi:hypothetical protein FPQ18DRAFT_349305 [Pyronema domesticum]|uniref:Similar to Pyridoxamine 5&apos acc. no. Q9UUK0 n=1 Tax=Pyronema omphalodes (strain CBS 100304) TaxID=1076935 RepID=U4KUZ5_PYROM|nr:hypothetical protein FPQ18DRAFT_349305 [Pyronema domesticum]CCX04947.1 Similar to Pyridoxamine 5' acc. no. Q9UUK0 [Pyronema omphalodes CBS 100304]